MGILNSGDNTDLIEWLPDGCGFVIKDKKKCLDQVLSIHFGMSKYPSFTRRLKRWDFVHNQRGNKVAFYFHRLFRREDPDACKEMKSIPQKKYTKKKSLKALQQNGSDPKHVNPVMHPLPPLFASNGHAQLSQHNSYLESALGRRNQLQHPMQQVMAAHSIRTHLGNENYTNSIHQNFLTSLVEGREGRENAFLRVSNGNYAVDSTGPTSVSMLPPRQYAGYNSDSHLAQLPMNSVSMPDLNQYPSYGPVDSSEINRLRSYLHPQY